MRICIAHEYFRPYITGGADLFLVALSDYLVSKGFDIDVITTHQKNLKYEELSDDIHIYRFKSSPIKLGYMYQFPGITIPWNYFNYPLISKMKEIMKKADILYINNIFQLSFSPFIAATTLNKPIVFDIHDYWSICFKKDLLYNNEPCRINNIFNCAKCLLNISFNLDFLVPFYLPLVFIDNTLKKHFLKPDFTITHSDFVRRKVKEFIKTPIQVIPYPYLGKIYKRKGRIGKEIKILFIGRINQQKGAHIIPEIATELKNQNISYEFDIIGGGSILESLKERSKKLNINFHGPIYDENVKRKFFLDSDVLLIPSFGEEPFGIVVLEGMAHGLPIISTNRGGLGELVENNEVGLVCEPDPKKIVKSINRLFSDKKQYKKFSNNGYKNIKKFLPSNIFNEYKKVFEQLLH